MISVIIPVLNEEKHLPNLLNDLNSIKDQLEIIVVDGGSTDQSINRAAEFKVKVIKSMSGKAIQMNKAAKVAQNEYLLFLHADSRLPLNSLNALIKEYRKNLESASFYVSFNVEGFLYRAYSKLSRINHYLFTYGDQGLLVKKQIFESLGGFKEIPIMEDIDFIKRLKKKHTFKKLNYPIITSARRFKEHGAFIQQVKNILLVILFLIGVSPKRLAKYYQYK